MSVMNVERNIHLVIYPQIKSYNRATELPKILVCNYPHTGIKKERDLDLSIVT